MVNYRCFGRWPVSFASGSPGPVGWVSAEADGGSPYWLTLITSDRAHSELQMDLLLHSVIYHYFQLSVFLRILYGNFINRTLRTR